MAGESSSMSTLEMGGRESEFSTNSGMTSEGQSSSTHDHSSTTMLCSYCMRHGPSFVNPPSGSLYLCAFDVEEDLLFHPQVAMRLNGAGPSGLVRRKTFKVPMLAMKEGEVKEPARKECRNCRAAAASSKLSIMNAPIHISPREPAGPNVRVVVPDGMRSWYITLPPRSQGFGVQRRRRACGDCNVNGQQHLVRIPGDCHATEVMVIPTKQVLLHMLDRLPLAMYGDILSQKQMNVKVQLFLQVWMYIQDQGLWMYLFHMHNTGESNYVENKVLRRSVHLQS
jgi:hypothetical protein